MSMRESGKKVLAKIPPAWEFVRRSEEHVKGMVAPGTLFEELGFNYIGPIDGHDLPTLLHTVKNIRDLRGGATLLHVVTAKGKGFAPAENDPVGYHAINKIEAKSKAMELADQPVSKKPKYQDVFGDWLCDMAAQDKSLIGITPAMCEGSGMVQFAKQYPDRFHDVAIAEQHAVTLAAGFACESLKPVVAIYSTFLQRGYDQLVHDVALQDLDVLFAIDRAGLVGQDGPTHAGSFDLSYLRCIPNMVIMAPSDENECRQLLTTGYQHKGPAAVRYPRGTGTGIQIEQSLQQVTIGEAVKRRDGKKVAILAFGTVLAPAMEAAEKLDACVIDMRFVKPLDEALVIELCGQFSLLVTVEENAIAGGAGAAVNELLAANNILMPTLNLGLPDQFLEHGDHQEQLANIGLNAEGIAESITRHLQTLVVNKTPRIA
jgi:1-deoxy-D-xylulose-5-phosphate synthase